MKIAGQVSSAAGLDGECELCSECCHMVVAI